MISASLHSKYPQKQPIFALLYVEEIQKLGELKASGTTIRIYMALCSYAMNRSFCFPNYETIARIAGIQTKAFQQVISRSLQWLQEHQFVQKSTNKTSKSRYFLIFRNEIISQTKVKTQELSSLLPANQEIVQQEIVQQEIIEKQYIQPSIKKDFDDTKNRTSKNVNIKDLSNRYSIQVSDLSGSQSQKEDQKEDHDLKEENISLSNSANNNDGLLNNSANKREHQEDIILIPPLTPPKEGGENKYDPKINLDHDQDDEKIEKRMYMEHSNKVHGTNIHTTDSIQYYPMYFANPSNIMSKSMAQAYFQQEKHQEEKHQENRKKSNHNEIQDNCVELKNQNKNPKILSKQDKTQEQCKKFQLAVLQKAQRCFEEKIVHKLPLNVEDINVFQKAMEIDTQWYNWMTGFHFSYFQSIMGYRPSEEEIKKAQSNWLLFEQNKEFEKQSIKQQEQNAVRNQIIEKQLGISQTQFSASEHMPSQTSTESRLKQQERNSEIQKLDEKQKTKNRSERKPRNREQSNRKQSNRKTPKQNRVYHNNFDGGTSHPDYWPQQPAVEQLVSHLITKNEKPTDQESFYIRTYAKQHNEWYHWLRSHQPHLFEHVYQCMVSSEQKEQSNQIWNQIIIQKMQF